MKSKLFRRLTELSPVEWLEPHRRNHDPNGYARPLRPDIPILRNLSYIKYHALQIGMFGALFVYWSFSLGYTETGFVVAAFLVRTALGIREKKDPDRKCQHNVGLHDIRTKPWYFASSFLSTSILLNLFFGPVFFP